MELEVELSHLVFAELYNILAGRNSLSDMLDDRLNSIDLNHSWLPTASDLYNAKWDEICKDADSVADFTHLSSEHAHFASWILASLRGTGQCTDISIELRRSVTDRFIKEVPGSPPLLPSPWRPVIQGWALGMVLGQFDHDLPAIPPKMPQDANVNAALEGLIEHLLFFDNACSSWPEVSATAVHWRGSGLLEAMQPEAKNAPDAMRLLLPTIRQYLSGYQGRILGQHFSTMVQPRNSLTHIADTPNCPRFVEVVSDWCDENRIKNTVMGVTQLLFAQYSSTLADPRSINPKIWDLLYWDVAT
jgi:hypothetical protein